MILTVAEGPVLSFDHLPLSLVYVTCPVQLSPPDHSTLNDGPCSCFLPSYRPHDAVCGLPATACGQWEKGLHIVAVPCVEEHPPRRRIFHFLRWTGSPTYSTNSGVI